MLSYLAKVGGLGRGHWRPQRAWMRQWRAEATVTYKHCFSHIGLLTPPCTQAGVPDWSATEVAPGR